MITHQGEANTCEHHETGPEVGEHNQRGDEHRGQGQTNVPKHFLGNDLHSMRNVVRPNWQRRNTYMTSLQLVSVRRHGRVTQWTSR